MSTLDVKSAEPVDERDSTYYPLYLKYKQKYLTLIDLLQKNSSKIINFSKIVEAAYKYAINEFGDMYIIIDDDPYEIFRLHYFGEDKRYTPNRYKDSDKPIECENKKFSVYNPDITYEFINERKGIFIDTKINKLPINASTGTTRWESYNWTLYRNPDRTFHIAFGRMDDSFKAELGVKHTMLGQKNDFYAGGEIRIVHDINNFNKKIVQVNLDSSSFGPGFANIFKNLCNRYKECMPYITTQDVITSDKYYEELKLFCPFGLKDEKYIAVCDNFSSKYDDILDFKIIGKVPGQQKSHFEEPEKSVKYEKFQNIFDEMTTVIKNVMKHIFQNIIDDPTYVLQVVGDNEWYDVGLNGRRGLHWYYYNDVCPSAEYINEANEWAQRNISLGATTSVTPAGSTAAHEQKDNFFIKQIND
jgi:hypothetical protein